MCLLLSGLGVILAIDLEAIDPGYYVEPSGTSEPIDYKDPCKAGERFPLSLSAEAGCDPARVCGGRHMPRLLFFFPLSLQRRFEGDDSGGCGFYEARENVLRLCFAPNDTVCNV